MKNNIPKMEHSQLIPTDAVITEMKFKNVMKHRKIDISGEIDRDEIFKAMYYINKLVEQDKLTNTKEAITIVVNSFGGEIYFGLGLLSLIESLKKNGYSIDTEVTGVAMSMGAQILLTGSKRRAYKYSTIMIHQPSSGTWGDLQSQQENIAETVRLWVLMKKIIKENTDITEEQLEDLKSHKRDWFMDAETALKYGVIHEII